MATNKLFQEEKNPRMRETWLEWLLAITVIRNTLGEEWWQNGIEEVDSWIRGERRETPMVRPLSAFMTVGGAKSVPPEVAGELINLGIDLLTLLDQPGANESLEDKLTELRSKSKSEFLKTWFEIRMAATFIKKGMHAVLLPSTKKAKRPDIQARISNEKVFVECKARSRLSPEERDFDEDYRKGMKVRLSGVEELIRKASLQLQDQSSPTLIAVNVELPETMAGRYELKELRSIMEYALIRHPHLNGIMYVEDRVKRVVAAERVEWGQQLDLQQSLNPERPNPAEFFRILMDPKITTRPPTLMLTKYAMAH